MADKNQPSDPGPTPPSADQDLDPTKVVGKYAMQPDPNDDVPGPPPPNIPAGVKEAPADDVPGTPAVPNADGDKKSQPANK